MKEEERENKENAGQVFEVGSRSGIVYAGVYGKRGVAKKKLRGRVGIRAWGYKRKLGKGKGELTRLCWKDLRRRAKGGR